MSSNSKKANNEGIYFSKYYDKDSSIKPLRAISKHCGYDCSERKAQCKRKKCSLYPLRNADAAKYPEVLKRIVGKCKECVSEKAEGNEKLESLLIDRCNNENCKLYAWRPLHMEYC